MESREVSLTKTGDRLNVASAGAAEFEALVEDCARRVPAAVPPLLLETVTVHRESARVALRTDGLWLVEVPYSAESDGARRDGSYVGISSGKERGSTFMFLSDRTRLSANDWASYISAERPGNL